jgi:hypothetical protein
MKIDLEVESLNEIPSRFTGVVHVVAVCPCCDRIIFLKDGEYHRLDGPAVDHSNGDKIWYKEGDLHRIDGPAVEWANGNKEWFVDGIEYCSMKLKDSIIFDYFKGAYNIMWYKILTEDGITEYPDMPGLIDKG